VKVTEQTKAHAQEILDFLSENPQVHKQFTFFYGDVETLQEDPTNLCGTQLCVAGTSVLLADGVEGIIKCENNVVDGLETWSYSNIAAKNLGLTYEPNASFLNANHYETLQAEANALFFCMDETSALDMLRAIRDGDETKFWAVHAAHVDNVMADDDV
jgi:hypothetical protein